MTRPWKHISEDGILAKEYIRKRKTGEIKSLKTPWNKVNQELLNGLEWNTTIQLAGSSGTGKTAIKDQLTRGLLDLNPDQDFNVLDFQFEMIGRTSVIRDLSRVTKKDIKVLSSAFESLSDADFESISYYIDNDLSRYNIFTVDVPKSVAAIEAIARQFFLETGKPFVATIDHSILVPKATEKDDWEVIRRLADMVIRTKKELPIIWIILNQLNRDYEKPERQLPNSMAAFPNKKDIYGGDTIFFASDAVIVIVKPDQFLQLGSFYGPQRSNSDVNRVTPNLMAWHILKNRVGEPNVQLTMRSNFESMSVIDPSM